MVDLPDDVLFQIFSRLPAKPLAALQTLSKHICEEIRSRKFQDLQSRRQNYDLGIIARDMNGEDDLLVMEDSAGVPPSSLKFFNQGGKRIVGSNEGLIVFLEKDGNLLLYNPPLGEILPIGRPSEAVLPVRCATILRGEGSDLRVVCFLERANEPRAHVECWVYSTALKCWAAVSDDVSALCSDTEELRHPIAGPHGLVFLASVSGDYFQIIAINTYTGYTEPVPKPKIFDNPWIGLNIEIGRPKGGYLLSLVTYNSYTSEFGIWDLKDGEKRAWEKRGSDLSMAAMGLDPSYVESSSLVNGEVLVISVHGQVYAYDIDKSTLRDLGSKSWTYSFLCPYANTLQHCE